ncbi:MAG: hypothetical protein U0R70_14860 [Solirubrobacteraceae bacterium]
MRKAATTAAAVVLAATGLATGGISPATAAPGDLPGGTDSTCFWYYGAFGGSPKTFNMAYPDAGARYWGAIFRRPPGSTLKIHGLYPHARYTSLISYDALGQIVDGLADYQIDPDPGSTNPFRPGARRDGRSRSYTVTILDQQNLDPATGRTLFNKTNPRTNERHRNALYARGDTPTFENVGGTTYEFQGFAVRVYIPDRGRDLRGGVPLPTPELILADGTRLTGQAACDALDSQSKDRIAHGLGPRLPDPRALIIQPAVYQALRHPEKLAQPCNVLTPFASTCATAFTLPQALVQVPRQVADPGTFPAKRVPEWRAQYDRRYLMQLWTGDNGPGANRKPVRAGGGGFFPNLHNNYVRAALNRGLGKVVALRGTMATTPHTYNRDPVMRATQLRYQSFCMNEAVATTRVMDCVYDEEVPLSRGRRYVVVTSRKADRPRNATARCGVAWIEWSKRGDGAGDPNFGWIQIRNMLPAPGFNHAVQNTQVPGDEKRVMGRYLPKVTYYRDTRAFEKLGCPVG